MKYLKTFEGAKYKDESIYDNLFKFKIDTPVKFLKDELNGFKAPNLSDDVYFIQSRTYKIKKNYKNHYLLYDLIGESLNWVIEDLIRFATEKEVEDAKLRAEAKKYNL